MSARKSSYDVHVRGYKNWGTNIQQCLSEFEAGQCIRHTGESFSDALAALSQEERDAYLLCLEYSFLAHMQKRQFSWTDVSASQMCGRLTGWSDMHCQIAQLQDRLHFHHEILECFIDLHRNAEQLALLMVKDYIAYATSRDDCGQTHLARPFLQEYAMTWKDGDVELLRIAKSAPILYGLIGSEADRLLNDIKRPAGLHVFL
ncbi:MAG: hypothetical protein Q7K57_46140 [Burkholderiaceae bacterium]|nr:hypothetical protein [Burkholderiaceae bacterium]